MPKPQAAPVTQIENVTLALAQWLRDGRFSPEPTDAIDPADPKAEEKLAYRKTAECMYYCADAAAISDSSRAIAVHVALGYLLGTVLREHHREARRAKLVAEFGPDDPRLLAFSRTRADLGHAARRLIGPIAHMKKLVRQWEAERGRWEQLGLPQGEEDVRTAYDAFARAGERLLRAIEPPTLDSGVLALPVPWTMDDWLETAVELEVSLFDAGFTDPEIAPLFGRSGPELVTQARYRRNVSRIALPTSESSKL